MAEAGTAAEFYNANVQREWERLDRHRTEFAVTMRALAEFLPPPPATIADIGGGPGRYALELADRYDVTLVDVSKASLDFARAKAGERGVELAGYAHADARDLSETASEAFDAVLLMGPLYHLLAESDRQQAVAETRRLLKPGGVMFASFVTRYAHIRFWAKTDPRRVVGHIDRYEHLLATGEIVADEIAADGEFADMYCVLPADVRPFMESAGFATREVVACEGLTSLIEEQINDMTGDAWRAWVDLNYRVAKDPSLHGGVEHLLYVGVKE